MSSGPAASPSVYAVGGRVSPAPVGSWSAAVSPPMLASCVMATVYPKVVNRSQRTGQSLEAQASSVGS